jgi:23S rRNA (uracil1939-C5)-methyltransferase
MTANSQIQVKIEKMAIGGAGIARHDGLVIFVPQAAPEDELLVELTAKKKNYAEARIIEILKPGPARRDPPCKVANLCGGCNWQHLNEQEQRLQKESLVLETIKKFNPNLEFTQLPIKDSPRVFRYRNRIQPKFKNGKLGFFARNSHEIVEIDDCLITEETLTKKFPEIKKWASAQKSNDLLRLEAYISNQEEVHFGLITDEDEGVGFSQVNRFQNEDLIQTVLDWSNIEPGQNHYEQVFDLYAGSGNFTIPLLNQFKASSVMAVELNEKLVLRGRAQNKDKRLSYFTSDVESYLKRAHLTENDLVVLDPPRAGTSEYIMRALASAKPKKIIYISCHPVSLARDLKWFFDWNQKMGHNYKLSRLQTFEMFPQTDHVETIAELKVD